MSKLLVFCLDALCTCDIEYMRTLPHFKQIIENGSYVKHVEPVYPSLTYPCHCSILTGRTVKGHGIPHNEIVDIEDETPPWYSFRSQIKCRTLMDVAHDYGKKTCSLSWPVSGGADIDLNMPMIVPVSYSGDNPYQYLENQATQELLDKYYWKYKHHLMGEDRSLDLYTMSLAIDILQDYGQPDVMLVKMCDLDTVKHVNGVMNDHVRHQLRKHDTELGRIMEALERFGDLEDTNIVILGDHGQQDVDRILNFNLLLKEKGYIRTDENGKLIDWDVYCHSAALSAWIELKDKNNEELRKEVYEFLLECKNTPEYNIGYVFTKEEAEEQYGLAFEHIDFVIEGKEPMSFGSTLSGRDLFKEYLKPGWHSNHASHGHLPSSDETTTFIAYGKNVKKGVVIERGSMVNEASTMACMLGMEMNDTEGSPWYEMIK